MTPEQTRQLNRMIRRQRLWKWGPVFAAAIAIFGGYSWLTAEKLARVDQVVETREMEGEVTDAARLTGRKGGFAVHVRLPGGEEVDAYSQLAEPLHAGEHVAIRSIAHASGRTTYNIVKVEHH
ncbi:MAG: hypothetical protein AB7U38_02990 [Hyphomicrobiales bacterium]